ncbi:MAG: dihydropteroate synthase [Granulosicoccus sp.]|jgi:dihydropteroate synthase
MAKFNLLKGRNHTLNLAGRLLVLNNPIVMGIINLTPDSFFDGGTLETEKDLLNRVEKQLTDGAIILDLGAYSSRPNAKDISEEEELARLIPNLKAVLSAFPDAITSVDTFRSNVGRQALDNGALLINDISGGELDSELPKVAAEFRVPYICMHMKGTPQNMQNNLEETEIMPDLLKHFSFKLKELNSLGLNDVIIDPGFGFGKTLDQNYEILSKFETLANFGAPVLAGISRKSMINRVLDTKPDQALNGTTALHMSLLDRGANILRVHDVKEAVETVKLFGKIT